MVKRVVFWGKYDKYANEACIMIITSMLLGSIGYAKNLVLVTRAL